MATTPVIQRWCSACCTGFPRPPAAAPPAPHALLEIAVAHGAVAPDGVGDLLDEARVLLEPLRPAGVAALVVEHGAPPPWQRGDRHEAGGVRPVLEEEAPAID